MSVPMRVIPGLIGTHGRCQYHGNTGNLVYIEQPLELLGIVVKDETPLLVNRINKRLGVPEDSDFVCYVYYAPYLMLKFSGSCKILTCYDSRENLDNASYYTPKELSEPSVRGSGSLQLLVGECEDGRATGGDVLSTEYDANASILRYQLSAKQATEYWLIGTGIIAGMEESELTELYLSDILVE